MQLSTALRKNYNFIMLEMKVLLAIHTPWELYRADALL